MRSFLKSEKWQGASTMTPPGRYSALLLALLLCPGGVLTQLEGTDIQKVGVSISGTSVTLTCPPGEETNPVNNFILKYNKELKLESKDGIFTLENYDESLNGLFKCEASYNSNAESFKRNLYLKAKVCELCIEMDIWTVIGILVADLLITLGVILLVYYWSKNKKGRTEGAGGHGSKPRGYSKERPPPIPNPDYEPIRKGQREVYDGLNSRP